MSSPSEQSPHPDPEKKYFGRHRPTALSRTVFAAIAAATLIGAGVTAANAGGPAEEKAVTVATADREDQDQADRSKEREEAATPPATEEQEKDAAKEPEVKPAQEEETPDWVTPSPAPISDVFGPRDWRAGEMHYGMDFAAAEGQENFAAADGVVVQAGANGGYGNSVIIDHGEGILTVYGHHSQVKVSVGDEVKAGDVIGLAGSTGDVTGPHLHFEIHIDTVAVDPEKFLTEHGVKF